MSASSDQGALRLRPASMQQPTQVPRPPIRWFVRGVVPATVLLAAAGLLALAARDAFRPGLAVRVVAAVPSSEAFVADGDGGGAQTSDLVVQAPGWIEPAPFATSVPALVGGVVREVLVLEGDRVEAGAVVVRLVDDDARLDLALADAMVEARRAERLRAEAGVAAAKAAVRVEGSAVAELRDEVERSRSAAEAGAVAEGRLRRLELRLEGLEARRDLAERQADEADARVLEAAAAERAALVARDVARLALERTEIRAPEGGVVLARLVEPGTRIGTAQHPGEGGGDGGAHGTVLRLYDPSRLQVRVDVPLADAANVGVGTRAVVTTEALAGRSFDGVVVRAVHEANIQRNTMQYKVELAAPAEELRPEMLVRVRLVGSSGAADGGAESDLARAGGSDGQVLLVPSAALVERNGDRGSIWLAVLEGRTHVARRRDVAFTPSTDAGFVAVRDGLRITDRVVLDPSTIQGLEDGVRVRPLDASAGGTGP
jgi:multidrug efflux pump subunit AcrA (membrane-fusion protein)